MKTHSFKSSLLYIPFALIGLFSSAASAEGHSEAPFNIGEITCWDYTALEGSDRVAAASLVFGFVAGKLGVPTQSGSAIKKSMEHADRLCDANPDMHVSRAVERALAEKNAR